MNIQQRGATSVPATNVTAGARKARRAGEFRHRGDGPEQGPRRVQVQPCAWHGRELPVFSQPQRSTGLVAKSFTPETEVGSAGSDLLRRGRLLVRGNVLDTRVAYHVDRITLQPTSWASCPTGVGAPTAMSGCTCGPHAIRPWLREFFPDYQIVTMTRADTGAFDSRYVRLSHTDHASERHVHRRAA